MNANTSLRLRKEARAVLPLWAVSAVWMIAPFLLRANDPLPYLWGGFLFGCTVLGSVCVGHEFTHRTMGGLLAQPVPRRQLWWEKLAVSGASLLSLSLLFIGLMQIPEFKEEIYLRADEVDFLRGALFLAVLVLIPLIGFCTGPTLTLWTRNSLGGAALTFILPFFLLTVGALLWNIVGIPQDFENEIAQSYVVLVGGIYAGGVFLWGCRRFERLEDANLLEQEVTVPRQFIALFSGLTQQLAPAQHSPTLNLLRKELRLQQPAFLVAAFLVALWLAFAGVWTVGSAFNGDLMLIPVIFLTFGIPVTVGIISTAEERRLGVHDWHLTLPVTARRLWTVKLLVALGVNVLLGLLLPGLLAHAAGWLANDPRLWREIHGFAQQLPIANLGIVCVATFASTTASNPMRALIGTVALFVTIPLAYRLIEWATSFKGEGILNIMEWPWVEASLLASLLPDTFAASNEEVRAGCLSFGALAVGIMSCQFIAAVLVIRKLWRYPLANFRWRPDSALVPVRQTVAETSVMVGLLLVSVGLMKFVRYLW